MDVTGIVFGVAGLLVLGLVVWAGHRMLTERRSGASSATGGALGNFIDVFDPARARADLDLDSKEHQGEVLPSPTTTTCRCGSTSSPAEPGSRGASRSAPRGRRAPPPPPGRR